MLENRDNAPPPAHVRHVESSVAVKSLPSLPRDSRQLAQYLDTVCLSLPSLYDRQPQPSAAHRVRIGSVRKDSRNNSVQRNEGLFVLDESLGLPRQWVTLTADLIKMIGQLSLLPGFKPTPAEVATFVFARRPEHVTDWSPGAMNTFNSLYYRTPNSFSDLPPLYTSVPSVARAFARHLSELLPPGNVRIEELCAGPKCLYRWGYLAAFAGNRNQISLTLSDASPLLLTRIEKPWKNLEYRVERRDLLDPVPETPVNTRLHAMVATYGFDSVWLPGDRTVIKSGDTWYEAVYRIAVPDSHPQRLLMQEAFRTNHTAGLEPEMFKRLIIERAVTPFDTGANPEIAALLEERLRQNDRGVIVIPGGLVRWIDDAFARRLRPDGAFIVADCGPYNQRDASVHDYDTTGCAAKFKAIDFSMAEKLLTARGYRVEVRSIGDFISHNNRADTEFLGSEVDLDGPLPPHQYVMTVRRADALR